MLILLTVLLSDILKCVTCALRLQVAFPIQVRNIHWNENDDNLRHSNISNAVNNMSLCTVGLTSHHGLSTAIGNIGSQSQLN